MQEELIKLFDLADEDYGKLDNAGLTAMSLRMSEFIKGKIPRPADAAQAQRTPTPMALWAPQKVAEKEWRKWPLLLGKHTTGWRGWSVRWETNAREVIVNLDSGFVACNRLGISDKKRYTTPEPSRVAAPPDDFAAATTSTGVQIYRIFEEKEENEPAPGRFAVTVLNYDVKSNTVVTEVVKAGPPREENGDWREAETPGVKDSVTGGLEAGQMRLAGKNLEVSVALPREQAPAAAKGVRSGLPIIRGALLLVGLDVDDPIMVSFWAPAKKDAAGMVTAAFTLELGTLLQGTELAGSLQTYVAIGGQVLGPLEVAF